MNLPDLKELSRVIALCRKQGVKSIKIDNVELTLQDVAPLPAKRNRKPKAQVPTDFGSNDEYTSEEPTELDLLFYSAGGVPDELRE